MAQNINIGTYSAALTLAAAGTQPIPVVIYKKPVLNFPDKIITGINIIDDFLFWTDGETEPKKINIQRSKDGTGVSGLTPTKLINLSRGINIPSNVYVREEHISVIKKSPLSAPRLSLLGRKDGESYGKAFHNFSTVSFGDSINIGIDAFVSGASLNYETGDILLLKQIDNPVQADFPVTDFDIRLVITGISGTGNSTVFSCEVLSIGAFNVAAGMQMFASDLDNYYEKLYHLKFPRFAYRYKYSDKEYSVMGPFSEVAFKPSPFDFSPQKASNLGMENSLRYLAIEHLIPQNLPKDVVQVDLLYKDSSSPNVYLVDEIKPQNTAWILNKYNITKETIKGAIQSNQLLRSWDNVPKKALAQELSGNRIIYGNFFQNYSLEDYVVKLNAVLIPRVLSDNSYLKSIKSLREYQVGIVYSDAYGRQSPVLTSPDSSIKVGKLDATKNTQIELVSSAVPPTWAKYQKFYIKETSTEYYNLSLDRYFDAEDGNLWLSFPSSDRNKLTLEDSLYLKKAYLSAEGGFNSEKYKVIDIQNEAPEFIRTRRTILGKINNHAGWIENVSSQAENNILFRHANELPCRYEDEFRVNLLTLKNTILENFHKRHNSPDSDDATIGGGGGPMVNNPIFIRISSVISDGVSGHLPGPYKTDWYEVDNVSKSLTGDGHYIVRLKKPFGVDAVFTNTGDVNVVNDMAGYLTTGPTGSNVAEPYSLVFEVGQDIVQNKSIFQGRFFVKVFRDAALQESIVAPQITTNVQVLKTARVGYLKDFTQEDLGMTASAPVYGSYGISGGSITAAEHATEVSNFNTNGPTGNPGNLLSPIPDGVPIPTDAYCSWRAWHRIMEKLNSLESRWVIDEAYAAGEEPFYGMANFVDYNETNINTGGTSTIYGGYNKESANFWTLQHNANSGNYTPVGLFNLTGLGHGQNFADYEYFTIGKGLTDFTIDLSYIGVGRTENGTPDADSIFENLSATAADQIFVSQTANTQWITWWVISDGGNFGDALDQEARLFADYLIEDTRIRFTDDPNLVIYKITQVKKIYKYNYAEGVNDRNYVMASNQIGDQQSYGGAKHYYNRAHFNRRLTYRLTLQAEIANLPIGTDLMGNIGYNPLDGTDISGNFCNIEIVTANVVNEDNPLPEDPAIFETVPDNEDIDIYHECSDTIPIDLRFNAEAFAPVGSLVSCQDNSNGLNILYGEPRVLLWESGNILRVSGGYFIGANQTSNDLLTFTRPDGSYTTAMLNSVEQPFISGSGTAYNSYYASIQPIVSDKKVGIAWHNCYAFGNGVESDRIRDTYNSATIDNGPRVSTTFEDGYEEEHRKYGLIYSGLYNSNSGVNNLNQFIQAEKITKDLNPTYGSIQKLYAGWGQGGDLIALCEDRVLRILADKDALYNADGNMQLTSTNNVLGFAIPYAGEYGISKNPESFASEAFRCYFTDKVRGTVMRLSTDGLTPISDHGMKDWFRDHLQLGQELIGSYDDKKSEYNITLRGANIATTVSFREDVRGWVSFKSFVPENAISCANEYYTFLNGKLYQHHSTTANRNTFYGLPLVNSTLEAIFNEVPSSVKSFKTINYEGSRAKITQFLGADGEYFNLAGSTGWYVDDVATNLEHSGITEFIEKEGKWFGYITGDDVIINPAGLVTGNYDTEDSSIQGIGVLSGTNILNLFGCLDETMFNYEPAATNTCQVPTNCCIPFIYGCMDVSADNYIATTGNPQIDVNTDNNSCLWYGCMTPLATLANESTWTNGTSGSINFDPQANFDDGTCTTAIYGCTDISAFNFDANANIASGILSDGTSCGYSNCMCIPIITGCTDPSASNYIVPSNPMTDVNTSSNTCVFNGCTNPIASNYSFPLSSPAITATGQTLIVNNVTLGTVFDDSSCIINYGCMDVLACNYDPIAFVEIPGSCQYCGDNNAENYDNGTCNDACIYCNPPSNLTVVSQTTSDTINGVDQNNGTVTLSLNETTIVTLPSQVLSWTLACSTYILQYRVLGTTNWNPSLTGITSLNYTLTNLSPNTTYQWRVKCTGTSWTGVPVNDFVTGASISIPNTFVEAYEISSSVGNFGGFIDASGNIPNAYGSSITSSGWGTGVITFTLTGLSLGANTITVSSFCGGQTSNNSWALNTMGYVNPTATVVIGATLIPGCMDNTGSGNNIVSTNGWGACNYDPLATIDDGSCIYNICAGCNDPAYMEYCDDCWDSTNQAQVASGGSPWVGLLPGSCTTLIIPGCTDDTMFNYNALANVDNGSCIPFVYGCMNATLNNDGTYATNFDIAANTPCDASGTGAGNNECCNPYNCAIPDLQWVPNPGIVQALYLSDNIPWGPLQTTSGGYPTITLQHYTPTLVVTDAVGNIIQTNPSNWILQGVGWASYGYITSVNIPQAQLNAWAVGQTQIQLEFTLSRPVGTYPDNGCSNSDTLILNVGCKDALASNYDANAHLADNGQCAYPPGCMDSTLNNNGSSFAASNYNTVYQSSCGGNNSCCTYVTSPMLIATAAVQNIQLRTSGTANTPLTSVGSHVSGQIASSAGYYFINAAGNQTPLQTYSLVAIPNPMSTSVVYDITNWVPHVKGIYPNQEVEIAVRGRFQGTVDNDYINDLLMVFSPWWTQTFTAGCKVNDLAPGTIALNLQSNVDLHIPGSCIAVVTGCTDPTATNYNAAANTDDGSCTYPIIGCMDNSYAPPLGLPDVYAATNYDPLATVNCNATSTAAGTGECCLYSCPTLSFYITQTPDTFENKINCIIDSTNVWEYRQPVIGLANQNFGLKNYDFVGVTWSATTATGSTGGTLSVFPSQSIDSSWSTSSITSIITANTKVALLANNPNLSQITPGGDITLTLNMSGVNYASQPNANAFGGTTPIHCQSINATTLVLKTGCMDIGYLSYNQNALFHIQTQCF